MDVDPDGVLHILRISLEAQVVVSRKREVFVNVAYSEIPEMFEAARENEQVRVRRPVLLFILNEVFNHNSRHL